MNAQGGYTQIDDVISKFAQSYHQANVSLLMASVE